MEHTLFTGVSTALVTPFLNGAVNTPMLQQLLKYQMDNGIHSVVVCGTTGEAATLTEFEKLEIIQKSKEYVGNACQVIAGTGCNCTSKTIERSIAAQEAGADALLVVTPYYNKPTPDGLFAHYAAVAHSVSIPVIVYNVPSRTGTDIPVSVYKRLSIIPNIAGVKEASTDISKIIKIKVACPDTFCIWSGNDDLATPAICLGAKGVISVASNVVPFEVHDMATAALSGNYSKASILQRKLQPLIEQLFSQTNPIPVKEAMRAIGYDCGCCRLPLTKSTPEHAEAIQNCLEVLKSTW